MIKGWNGKKRDRTWKEFWISKVLLYQLCIFGTCLFPVPFYSSTGVPWYYYCNASLTFYLENEGSSLRFSTSFKNKLNSCQTLASWHVTNYENTLCEIMFLITPTNTLYLKISSCLLGLKVPFTSMPFFKFHYDVGFKPWVLTNQRDLNCL